jgi:hypothetical protein
MGFVMILVGVVVCFVSLGVGIFTALAGVAVLLAGRLM